MKVGVLVVAYNAQTTLVDVLDRIRPEMRRALAEVLVQDDHSTDDTFSVATEYLQRGTDLPLTVVRHPQNLGYGGNQKAGYTYAINHGWDVVVLLHGDGQYAPEVMHEMVAPIVDGDADAVFGSRMMTPGGARQGGMPMYKYVGNRILTTAQNAITGLRLSEWHSGYRAYRVSALAELPFVGNSDGFDFDTEIILQLAAARKTIVEVPIPTYYGDEICRVNGIAYARDIMIDTVRHRLGRTGFGSGDVGRVTEPYAYKPSPHSSHGRVLQFMQSRAPMRVLDVGCGPGWLAEALMAQGHHVTGVDLAEDPGARDRMHHFVQADLERGLPDEVGGDFDVVLAADVIEHVRTPQQLLQQMADRLKPGGTVIASVPNISHWYPRGRTALGLFDYDQRGILDATHVRFFTRRSFVRLARQAGLQPIDRRHTGLPFDALKLRTEGGPGKLAALVDRALVRLWPTMFAYQFVYELDVIPALDEPLDVATDAAG
ncbi:MAG: methyltransferase domain-containing protein [Acidimicrobiales bacterium]|nr:methyltransferase domain-containing protein [Acidimicrobiales bacterium]